MPWGPLIRGLHEPDEVLRIAAEHGVTFDIEMLDIKHINVEYERMKRSNASYRFVIEIETIKG